MKPLLSIIVAISENRVIGKDNALPWHIPEDLKRFKELTKGHPIIMGRKTFDSIGRVLPDRINIVITRDTESFLKKARDEGQKLQGLIAVSSLDEALDIVSNEQALTAGYEGDVDVSEVFIIGGGKVFEQALPEAEKLYLTIVHTTIEGDTYFPDFSAFPKKVFEKQGNNDRYTYTFLELEK